MSALPDGPLIAWCGDDFTGSAACMEVMAFAGLKSVLFLGQPTPEQFARFADARGVGVAGVARSQTPEHMAQTLPPVFAFLASLKAPITQYKICSTLDSAPHIGSIGRAYDLARPILGGAWTPLLIAAPDIRRWQAFGHLFAGAPEGVFRLDRHPTMRRHPVTPMDESDVRLHLSKQTAAPMGLVDLEGLGADPDASLTAALEAGAQIVALDCVGEATLAAAGRLIWEQRGDSLFAIGSQGVQYALIAHWRRAGLISPPPPTPAAPPADRMVAVSGSVSPVTAAQIDQALGAGFAGVTFEAASVLDPSAMAQAEQAAAAAAFDAIQSGRDPLIFTAKGPDDPAVARFRAAAASGVALDVANQRIGAALGRILGRILRQTGIGRAAIAGGDASGHATEHLGVFALTALAPTTSGAALFKAHSENPQFDGLELGLKGGQMGAPNYFASIRAGRAL